MWKAALFLCLLIPALSRGEETRILYKPAVLTMPGEIAYKKGGLNYSLSGEISFRWDESTLLTIRLWKKNGWFADASNKADQMMGRAEFFDEQGRSVPSWSVVTVPPPPSGEAIIQPGEKKTFGFFVWNQYPQFPGPGKYYVVAEFWDASTGKTRIVFKTAKRWFTVVEEPPDPKKQKL